MNCNPKVILMCKMWQNCWLLVPFDWADYMYELGIQALVLTMITLTL